MPTAEEESSHYQAVVAGGAKSSAIGLAGWGAAALAMQRFRVPLWVHSNVPIRAALTTIVALGSFAFGADQSSTKFIAQSVDKRGVGREDEERERETGIHSRDRAAMRARLSTRDQAIEWFKDHKWQAVGGSWVAGMGLSWLFRSQPMPFRQQIVQTRMAAQAITVAALVAAVGVSSIRTGADDTDEATDNQAIRESAMYRYKKGSEADRVHKVAAKHALEHQRAKPSQDTVATE